jgi:hypothetical protein
MKKTLWTTLALVALVTLLPLAVSAQQGEALEPSFLEPLPVPACGGDCNGSSTGSKTSTKACEDLTDAEKQTLTDDACGQTSKANARRNANDDCLDKDTSGNCLCTNGQFSGPSGTPFNNGDGLCQVICVLSYTGTCNTVTAAQPTE